MCKYCQPKLLTTWVDDPFAASSKDDNSICDAEDNIIESENVGRHAFAHMTGDQDAISHERLQGKSLEEMRIYEQQKVYARWVKRGRSQDFSDLKKLKMIYHCGHDIIGRPVILIIGKRFSDSTIDSDRVSVKLVNFRTSYPLNCCIAH